MKNPADTRILDFADACEPSKTAQIVKAADEEAKRRGVRLLRVTCGILRRGEFFFCARRGSMLGMAGKWEFPGGKIESDEAPADCVKRELREEIGVEAEVERYLGVAVHGYPDFVIELHVFVLNAGLQEPVLQEHTDGRWLDANELLDLPWDECDSLFVKLLKSYPD